MSKTLDRGSLIYFMIMCMHIVILFHMDWHNWNEYSINFALPSYEIMMGGEERKIKTEAEYQFVFFLS